MLTPPTTAPIIASALSGATWNTDDRTNITASSDGAVVQVAFDGIFGTYIVQTLPDGRYLSYSGLRAASVAVGEQIKVGDVIGTSSLSLHVVISDSVTGYRGDGTSFDPADYFAVPATEPSGDVPDPAALVEALPVSTPNVIEVGAPVAPVEAAPTEVAPVVASTPADTPQPGLTFALTPTTSTSGMIDGAGSVWVKPVTPEPDPSTWTVQSTLLVPAEPKPPVLTESNPVPADVHPVDQIVADAVATPKSVAAPLAHQAKGAPVKGGLTNLISLPFWNDTLTRAFNTFLQVGLTSIGAGAAHLFTVSDLTSLKIAGGAAVISLVQSLIRATSQTSK